MVAATVAGVAGDFVIDTGAPRTLLHDTRARSEGVAADDLTGDVQVAGATVAGLSVGVTDLDVRGWNLATPLAGVIGADALKAHVVDVSYAPCVIRLSPPGSAAPFRGHVLELGWDLGRPTAEAAVSDDAHEIRGWFVIASGANAPLRLADDLAQSPGLADAQELYPDGVWFARLPQVSFAGAVGRDVATGLMAPDGDVVGVLGGPVLAHFRLRFDFPAGRLIVQPVR